MYMALVNDALFMVSIKNASQPPTWRSKEVTSTKMSSIEKISIEYVKIVALRLKLMTLPYQWNILVGNLNIEWTKITIITQHFDTEPSLMISQELACKKKKKKFS